MADNTLALWAPFLFDLKGKVVEQGPPLEVLRQPKHERTRSFLKKILDRTD